MPYQRLADSFKKSHTKDQSDHGNEKYWQTIIAMLIANQKSRPRMYSLLGLEWSAKAPEPELISKSGGRNIPDLSLFTPEGSRIIEVKYSSRFSKEQLRLLYAQIIHHRFSSFREDHPELQPQVVIIGPRSCLDLVLRKVRNKKSWEHEPRKDRYGRVYTVTSTKTNGVDEFHLKIRLSDLVNGKAIGFSTEAQQGKNAFYESECRGNATFNHVVRLIRLEKICELAIELSSASPGALIAPLPLD